MSTNIPLPARHPQILPIAAGIWIICFALTAQFGISAPAMPLGLATFVAATILTLLSAFIVYAFSCLRLHRTTYLMIGALAAASTFYAATPMVQRNDAININASVPGQVISLSAATSGFSLPPEKLLSETIDRLASETGQKVADTIPEKTAMILLLALCQLTLASGLGLWIGEGIDEVSHLIPVAIVATLADIWSVSAGATSMIVVSSAINYFLLRFPLFGYDSIPYLIGLTDFLFFAIFFQASRRFELGTIKNAILLLSSFIITAAAAIFFQAGLPVLPFMAVFFVAGNFSKLKLKREEIKQIFVFLLLILAIFGTISAFNR